MARSKYTEDRVRRICQIIEKTGAEAPAIEAVDISKDTFYRWKRDKADFSDRIARAKEVWADTNDDEIIKTFRESLIKAMQGGVEEWESEEVTTLPDGSEVKKVTTKRVKRLPAQWALQIAAPVAGGDYGLEKKDVTSGGERLQGSTILVNPTGEVPDVE